ncbi:MAG: DUF418 domain-containing protein [Chitinophagales bacterium]|nr:DUF418 domain-containing protein [Chitinophagales bacterium]
MIFGRVFCSAASVSLYSDAFRSCSDYPFYHQNQRHGGFSPVQATERIILRTLWLQYFNYGPVEWLWRSATYKKWQPMKKRGQ